MRFLRISPSYAIALEVLNGVRKEDEASKQVVDIGQVIKTARYFGDVWTTTPDVHWRTKSFDLFGVQLAELDLKVVHVMQAGQNIDEYELGQKIKEYSAHTRKEMGNPLTALVSIPIDMNRQQLVQLFNGMLTYFKEHRQDFQEDFFPEPLFQINKSRKPFRTLAQLLEIVEFKAQNQKLKHWEVGVHRGINLVFGEILKKDIPPKEKAEAVNVMNATISRIYKQALLIAENAARGTYPSLDYRDGMLKEFDYQYIQEQLIKASTV
jgi:hypothetical protein